MGEIEIGSPIDTGSPITIGSVGPTEKELLLVAIDEKTGTLTSVPLKQSNIVFNLSDLKNLDASRYDFNSRVDKRGSYYLDLITRKYVKVKPLEGKIDEVIKQLTEIQTELKQLNLDLEILK